MKRLLILLLAIICIIGGTAAQSGTKVTSPIVPNSILDNYSTHQATFGKGGYRSVKTTTERDAIYTSRRDTGMLVYVSANDKIYILKDGITNSNWEELKLGSPASTDTVAYTRKNIDITPGGYVYPFRADGTNTNYSVFLNTYDATGNPVDAKFTKQNNSITVFPAVNCKLDALIVLNSFTQGTSGEGGGGGGIPPSRTLTINGTTQDLSENRTWTISAQEATPVLHNFTPSLVFNVKNEYFSNYTQTSDLVFSAPDTSYPGAYKYVRITTDGVHGLSFPFGWQAYRNDFTGAAGEYDFHCFLAVDKVIRYSLIEVVIDVTAPTLTSATAEAVTPGVINLTFSEIVSGSTSGWSIATTGPALSISSVSGTAKNRTFTLSRNITASETVTLSYSGGITKDLTGNALATISNFTVTNSVNFIVPTFDVNFQMTQSGNVVTGTGSGANKQWGVSSVDVISGDSYIIYKVMNLTSNLSCEIGYATTNTGFNTVNSWTTYSRTGISIQNVSGINMYHRQSGVSGFTNLSVEALIGDLVRVQLVRVDATNCNFILSYSRDAGSTWITLYTYATVANATPYYFVGLLGSSSFLSNISAGN